MIFKDLFIHVFYAWVLCLHAHQKKEYDPITDGVSHHVAAGKWTQDLQAQSSALHFHLIVFEEPLKKALERWLARSLGSFLLKLYFKKF